MSCFFRGLCWCFSTMFKVFLIKPYLSIIKFVSKYILTSVSIIHTSFKIMFLNFVLSRYTMCLFLYIYLIPMHLAKLLF